MSAPTATTIRNADLEHLHAILRGQHSHKLDLVAHARDLHSSAGNLTVIGGGGEPVISFDGVTPKDAILRPTTSADADIASKLEIPLTYLRRLRAEQIGLYDANVNTWLHGDPRRPFLIRGFTDNAPDTEQHDSTTTGGVLRALLSDSYRRIDNLDVLTAVLQGIKASGIPAEVTTADLSETRMYVKVFSPAVAAHAPALLQHYTSPFNGQRGVDNPTVFAGFVITNSETGHGRCAITPQLIVQICSNGMTLNKYALSAVHLGAKQPVGPINWSADTQAAETNLIIKQARDAVTQFLNPDFVAHHLARIEEVAGVAITDPPRTLKHLATELRFPVGVQETVLEHFYAGRDHTSGGVLHAVTSTAQLLPDPDAAYDLEGLGLKAMAIAARHA